MSKLYSKEDVNIDKRLGCAEDAISELYERVAALERKTKPLRLLKQPKKRAK
jgi:hypothetical protein